jgi:pimeloyl-ACP methyl ester carboxylesterase
MWREQIVFVSANGFRAIAPDLRGFGELSDKLQFVAGSEDSEAERQAEARRAITTMDDMARDVAALLDELQIETAVVCGLSMGGYVAFEFARLFATRLKGLVLAGTRAPADNDREKKGREQQVSLMLAEGMKPVAEASLPKLLAARTLAEKPAVVAQVRKMILRSNPISAAAAQRGMAARPDYTADMSEIKAPTLVIVGRDDPIRPVTDAEFMHEGIRNSKLEIIEEAAHMTNLEQTEFFNRAMQGFLELIH